MEGFPQVSYVDDIKNFREDKDKKSENDDEIDNRQKFDFEILSLYNSNVVPDDFLRMGTSFAVGPMLNFVRSAEEHLESYPFVDSV